MKIPGLGKLATFTLKRLVLPAIGRAIADPKNPLTIQAAKDALAKAAQEEAARQIGKRLGA